MFDYIKYTIFCVAATAIVMAIVAVVAESLPTGAAVALIIVGILTTALAVWRTMKTLQRDRTLNMTSDSAENDVRELLAQLNGQFNPYVIEAAEELGRLGDPATGPALTIVLERWAAAQPAGWEDVAKALIVAVGKVGDAGALPVLHRIAANGQYSVSYDASTSIEQIGGRATLLRSSQAPLAEPETLLRANVYSTDIDVEVLLKPSSSTAESLYTIDGD